MVEQWDTPYKVVMLIREFCDEFAVIVPFVAKSAASMLVLGASSGIYILAMKVFSRLRKRNPKRVNALVVELLWNPSELGFSLIERSRICWVRRVQLTSRFLGTCRSTTQSKETVWLH